MDTEGDIYVSLTQVNTDTPVMKMYLTHLCMQLDLDRPDWRSNTVLLMDGANYHVNDEVVAHLSLLKMPVIFTGPRSYDSCPCELLFAHLKAVDLNPEDKPTGKK